MARHARRAPRRTRLLCRSRFAALIGRRLACRFSVFRSVSGFDFACIGGLPIGSRVGNGSGGNGSGGNGSGDGSGAADSSDVHRLQDDDSRALAKATIASIAAASTGQQSQPEVVVDGQVVTLAEDAPAPDGEPAPNAETAETQDAPEPAPQEAEPAPRGDEQPVTADSPEETSDDALHATPDPASDEAPDEDAEPSQG